MEEAVSRAEKIAKYLRGPLVSLVHPPKDGRMTVKGAGEQEDTSAGIWHLQESREGVKMNVERIKGAGRNNYVEFRMGKTILEGTEDDFGNPMTGLVVEYIGGTLDAGTQASKDRAEAERCGWADVIAGVDFRMTKNRYSDLPEVRSLSIGAIADFLDTVSRIYDDDSFAGRDAVDFAQENMRLLLTGSSVGKFNKTFVSRELERIFKDKPTAFTDDGLYKVEFKVPDGAKKPKFFIEAVQKIEN